MNKIKVLFMAVVTGVLFSCAVDRLEDQVEVETTTTLEKRMQIGLNQTLRIPKVYATGFERIWSSNPFQKPVATVWVDGVATALTDGTQTAKGESIAIDQTNNVHVAGFENNGTNSVAKLWTNGVAMNLTDGTNNGRAFSVITDDNGNIYVGGYDGNAGKIWSIGGSTQTFTPSNPSSVIRVTSIFKYNSDIYACGYEMSSSGTNPNYRIWKNGNLLLNINGDTNNTDARSIFVNSGILYVVGREGDKAVLWINGVPQYLSSGTHSALAKSVYVVGSDVYVAGFEYTGSGRLAKLWKNGVGTNLTTDVNGNALASSVYVTGPTVYVGGAVRNPSFSNQPNVATMWRNNIATSWSTQNYEHEIFSIYVK